MREGSVEIGGDVVVVTTLVVDDDVSVDVVVPPAIDVDECGCWAL